MPTTIQLVVFAVWAVATAYLLNSGGRNNGIFSIVVRSGFRLILLGAIAAGLIGANGSDEAKWITDALVQFVLVLSAGIGGNYIAHANMSLRDFPNRLDGPEGFGQLTSDSPKKHTTRATNTSEMRSEARKPRKS